MEHDTIDVLRRHHAAWALLRADNAALVLSFLDRVFIEGNARAVARAQLVELLDDHLFALREHLGADAYPRSAADYLDSWAGADSGWLRKYYPPGADEPAFDATPAVERAVAFVRSLQSTAFIGTESRLKTLVELLRQIAVGSEADPQVRLEELQRRRRELDLEILRVSAGEVDVLDATAQRERYQQFAVAARDLLSDFRQVEENFRRLDLSVREKVAGWDGPKAELLVAVLSDRTGIADSDQGRSFSAFYDFLLSASRQEEFEELLSLVLDLQGPPGGDAGLRHIHHAWLAAAEQTQGTVRQLSEQLRRFLDDQVRLENRRVVELLRSIERSALAVRDAGPVPLLTELDGASVDLVLPVERPLYAPRRPLLLDSDGVRHASDLADATALFDQVHVDPAPLEDAVAGALQRRPTASLSDVLETRPLEQGLAELVTYFALRPPAVDVIVDDEREQVVRWTDDSGPDPVVREARVPLLVWSRTGGSP